METDTQTTSGENRCVPGRRPAPQSPVEHRQKHTWNGGPVCPTSASRPLNHCLSKPSFLPGDVSGRKVHSPLSSFTSLEADSRGNSIPVSSAHSAPRDTVHSHRKRSTARPPGGNIFKLRSERPGRSCDASGYHVIFNFCRRADSLGDRRFFLFFVFLNQIPFRAD